MHIQNILFPSIDTCDRIAMYYNMSNKPFICIDQKHVLFSKGDQLCSDTYFNSFSIGKWKNYTILSNLYISLLLNGHFEINIYHAKKVNGRIITQTILERCVYFSEEQYIKIPIEVNETTGIYYFSLMALNDNAKFSGGFYGSDLDENELPDIKLAIGICTFRREPYILHNLKIFTNSCISNEKSPLYGKLEIFISDNGKTLPNTLNTEHIRVFPNKNLGGAGGFTRCLIEILKVKEEKGITHILLMDDDVRIDPSSIERTYTLLRLLKNKFRAAFVGGHMLRLDQPNIQSEAADHWDIVAHHPVKYNYNLETIDKILKNEIEDSVNYLSWWYCCMPIDVVSPTNLPLPIFIKRDDIEYGLRNGKTFITLNGICVWHEPFEYKNSSYLEYYYWRNMCIINARHRLSFSGKRLLKVLRKSIIESLLTYRYKDAELALLGIQDYLKGVDWLKSQDGERLNQAIMQLSYKKVPVNELDYVFVHGQFEQHLQYMKESRLKRFCRRLSLNGWLLPANRNVVVPVYKPAKGYFYRATSVLNYEDATGMGFITHKNYHYLFYIIKFYYKIQKEVKKNFKKVTCEYRIRFDELTNLDFWNDYLQKSGDIINLKSGLSQKKRPQNTKYQIKELLKAYLLYALQIALLFLPVKKNRVMAYVHDRKGFTCNPKYIFNKLLERYGDQLELIWVTLYPESCDELRKMGIRVIRANSKEHFIAYLRTRIYITNDSFPSWAFHRWNQKWINTWHGGMNYKHIGYEYLAPMSHCNMRLFKMKNREPNFFLSGSEFFTKDTAASFYLNEKKFISTGLPRNDLFFVKRPDIEDKIRNRFMIDANIKIVLFAPTFRRGMKSQTFDLDFLALINTLKKRFGGEWVIFFRNHNFIKGKQCFPDSIDVSAYDDMQELLYVSDVLITDYSSCMWDFSLTQKPCFIYATDIDKYENEDRAFAYPVNDWPFPIATNNIELEKNILDFDYEKYQLNVELHLQKLGCYDKGDASQQMADLIAGFCITKSS
ncbi:hypothetical protein F220043C3_04720 [Enterocloster asparagiformis]|uniref:CDP-glycerol glycerophosphotransferase family protein n=1 Tax=Enterocloster asparagiformis TaxID=333367 RepID=UPI0034BC41E6